MHIKDIISKRIPASAAVGALLVAGLVLAGCGGSSKSASNIGAVAASKAAASAVSAGSSAGSSSAASPSSSVKLSGNSNSSFCVEATAVQAEQDKNGEELLGDTPADLQKFEEQSQAELKLFVSKAPAQIKSAVQTIATADDTLVNALKAANYDITKVDPKVTESLDTPAFESAVTTVDDYLEQVCGLHPTDDAS